MQVLFTTMLLFSTIAVLTKAELPTPTTWPEQFHFIIMMNFSGELQLKYLWYDWTNGRNFIITQSQLGKLRYDLELNNGTSFYYTLDSDGECTSVQFGIGILLPNWLEGGTYIGQRHVDGFLCYVWEKADFITYYEDVVTRRPVLWVFHTGRELHVMTFEVGEALEEKELQVPRYCYEKTTRVTTMAEVDGSIVHHQEYGGLANIAMYLGDM